MVVLILLIIGIIGLPINEFIFDWGRGATLTFTIINIAGLTVLAFAYWTTNKTS